MARAKIDNDIFLWNEKIVSRSDPYFFLSKWNKFKIVERVQYTNPLIFVAPKIIYHRLTHKSIIHLTSAGKYQYCLVRIWMVSLRYPKGSLTGINFEPLQLHELTD